MNTMYNDNDTYQTSKEESSSNLTLPVEIWMDIATYVPFPEFITVFPRLCSSFYWSIWKDHKTRTTWLYRFGPSDTNFQISYNYMDPNAIAVDDYRQYCAWLIDDGKRASTTLNNTDMVFEMVIISMHRNLVFPSYIEQHCFFKKTSFNGARLDQCFSSDTADEFAKTTLAEKVKAYKKPEEHHTRDGVTRFHECPPSRFARSTFLSSKEIQRLWDTIIYSKVHPLSVVMEDLNRSNDITFMHERRSYHRRRRNEPTQESKEEERQPVKAYSKGKQEKDKLSDESYSHQPEAKKFPNLFYLLVCFMNELQFHVHHRLIWDNCFDNMKSLDLPNNYLSYSDNVDTSTDGVNDKQDDNTVKNTSKTAATEVPNLESMMAQYAEKIKDQDTLLLTIMLCILRYSNGFSTDVPYDRACKLFDTFFSSKSFYLEKLLIPRVFGQPDPNDRQGSFQSFYRGLMNDLYMDDESKPVHRVAESFTHFTNIHNHMGWSPNIISKRDLETGSYYRMEKVFSTEDDNKSDDDEKIEHSLYAKRKKTTTATTFSSGGNHQSIGSTATAGNSNTATSTDTDGNNNSSTTEFATGYSDGIPVPKRKQVIRLLWFDGLKNSRVAFWMMSMQIFLDAVRSYQSLEEREVYGDALTNMLIAACDRFHDEEFEHRYSGQTRTTKADDDIYFHSEFNRFMEARTNQTQNQSVGSSL